MASQNATSQTKKVLGVGGFSTVYLDNFGGVECAIKYADSRENSRRHIRSEVRVLNALKGCKHVMQIVDYNISRDGYIRYEYLNKRLFDIMDDLTIDDIANIAAQLKEALQEIHSHGIIHCDIKPENIMFDAAGTLKLIDFGNAYFIDEIPYTMMHNGTIYYRAPELIIGAPIDYRIDYWAMGCVLIELLVKDVLFSPKRENNMYMHSYLLGEMMMVFGPFPRSFIQSGQSSHRYFVGDNLDFKFKYLLGKPTNLYKILRSFGFNRKDALYWSDSIKPCFIR